MEPKVLHFTSKAAVQYFLNILHLSKPFPVVCPKIYPCQPKWKCQLRVKSQRALGLKTTVPFSSAMIAASLEKVKPVGI